MPKDSPCSEGAHRMSAPARRARHLPVAQHPQPPHPVRLGIPAPLHLAARSVAGHPQDGRPLDPGERIEEDVEALALLVAAEEHHGGPALLVVHRLGRLEALHVHAVEEHLELAAARAHAGLTCRLRDGHPDLHPAPHQLGEGLEHRHPPAHPGPVVRPDHGERRREHEAVGRHRRQRLVHVHDVEAARPHEPLHPRRRRRPQRHRGHRPVGAQCRRSADDEVLPGGLGDGLALVGRPEHGDVVPRARRRRDRPITWPCTPPGRVREYGETMAILIAGRSASSAGRGATARGGADVVLEDGGQLLGHPRDVLAERPQPGGIDGCVHDASVPIPGPE